MSYFEVWASDPDPKTLDVDERAQWHTEQQAQEQRELARMFGFMVPEPRQGE
jgi:hypothetical protein